MDYVQLLSIKMDQVLMALALRFVSQYYSKSSWLSNTVAKTGSRGEVLSIREIPAPLKTPWRKINMKNKVVLD